MTGRAALLVPVAVLALLLLCAPPACRAQDDGAADSEVGLPAADAGQGGPGAVQADPSLKAPGYKV